MTILINDDKKLFTLQTRNTTYQMKVGDFDYLYHLYYGKRVDHQDMSYLLYDGPSHFAPYPYESENRGGSLTLMSQEFPTVGTGDLGSVALDIENADGTHVVNLKYKDYEIFDGKYSLAELPSFFSKGNDAKTLKITLVDVASDVEVELYYGVFEDKDVITRAVRISNLGVGSIQIHKAQSMSLDIVAGQYDLIHFHGRWASERNVERLPITHNVTTLGSDYGVSSAKENPGFIVAGKSTTEMTGDCFGFNLVYSGNFQATAERGTLGQNRVTLGLGDNQFSWRLEPGALFETPEAVMSFSSAGLTQLSHNFHNIIRENLCHSKYVNSPRPVLINNWEATYFDFTGKKLLQIAKSARDIGANMLVMDDGWFGERSDDTSSLGDWFVNEQKLGYTLNQLVQKVNNLGMEFGIWFEPEMVNEKSELYVNHPNWALNFPNQKPLLGRGQLVLDMSKKEVQEYLFERISDVLDSANISYVKWDMNRPITDWYSKDLSSGRQGELQHRYVLGLYKVLGALTRRYPDVLFEGCSSGGARFDLGMLAYEPQIWTSDNSDAINRLDIQYGTSFFYPLSTMGSHVSASPNHQNGRITSFETRANVAMAGTFGYELDVTKMSQAEKQQAKTATDFYKKVQELTFTGDYYRLHHSDDIVSWQIVAKDKSESLVTVVATDVVGNPPFVYIKLRGLDDNSRYLIGEKVYGGDALMNAGLKLPPFKGNYPSTRIYLKKVK